MSRNSHRTALITGGGSGIGAAISAAFAKDGTSVIIADHNEEAATALAETITTDGGSARAIVLDITDTVGVKNLVSELSASGLDVLVNNAGIGPEQATSTLTIEQFHTVLDVNLSGAVSLTLALADLLRASPSARVLNIASVQGMRGARDSLAYATSKGALINFTRALACDLADDGVLVNALAPGFVDTQLALLADGTREYDTEWFQDIYVKGGRIPLRRPAQSWELAEPARFLCSPANTYITGQVLAVDGGLTATF